MQQPASAAMRTASQLEPAEPEPGTAVSRSFSICSQKVPSFPSIASCGCWSPLMLDAETVADERSSGSGMQAPG